MQSLQEVVKIFGPADEASLQQLERCVNVEPSARAALMADHHKGYSMPIGGVVAYEKFISPSGVGFDIGCGNLYSETQIEARDVCIESLMGVIKKHISFGMGRNNAEPVKDHPVFDLVSQLTDILPDTHVQSLVAKARNQLGTVGSGNHYVDIFENRTTRRLGVGVHFGSRGVGHTLAKGFMAVAAGYGYSDTYKEGGMDALPLVLRADMPSGQDYERCMNIALAYAQAGREWVVNKIVHEFLGCKAEWSVHNNHNYAAREHHFGTDYFVHRKGATPAFPGQRGFVGATMGEDAVIVEGIDTEEAVFGLHSTVHGAGRVMSRTQAAGKIKTNKFWTCLNYRNCDNHVVARELKRGKDNSLPICTMCGGKMELKPREVSRVEGAINWPVVRQGIADQGIILIGGDADEAPGAYKRLPEVLGYHSGAIKVLHQLRPLGVAMAGKEVRDDYKD